MHLPEDAGEEEEEDAAGFGGERILRSCKTDRGDARERGGSENARQKGDSEDCKEKGDPGGCVGQGERRECEGEGRLGVCKGEGIPGECKEGGDSEAELRDLRPGEGRCECRREGRTQGRRRPRGCREPCPMSCGEEETPKSWKGDWRLEGSEGKGETWSCKCAGQCKELERSPGGCRVVGTPRDCWGEGRSRRQQGSGETRQLESAPPPSVSFFCSHSSLQVIWGCATPKPGYCAPGESCRLTAESGGCLCFLDGRIGKM